MKHLIQHIAPQELLSKFAGMLANSNLVWLKNLLIRYFLSKFNLKMEEAVETDPYAYESFNALFTRNLKSDVRPVDESENKIVSPADGAIAQVGYLKDTLIHAKGREFHLPELLGSNEIDSSRFVNGSFMTIYLAPLDYHRVHMPVTGTLSQMVYVPGKLFSVNTATANAIPNLFGRNERVVSVFDTDHGKVIVILVGAMLVGHINMTWAGTVNEDHGKDIIAKNYHHTPEQQIMLKKGDEVGHFRMGSTAIIISEKDRVNWHEDLVVGSKLQFGQAIGDIN